MADQDASVEYKRGKARELAKKIVEYQKENPDAPVYVMGLSAGTSIAVFTLEELPASNKVDDVFLFGASINLFSYGSTKQDWVGSTVNPTPPPPTSSVSEEVTASAMNTNYNGVGSAAGEIALGLKWEKGDFAIEGQLSKALLTNGPYFIGGVQSGLFTSVGVSAGF